MKIFKPAEQAILLVVVVIAIFFALGKTAYEAMSHEVKSYDQVRLDRLKQPVNTTYAQYEIWDYTKGSE